MRLSVKNVSSLAASVALGLVFFGAGNAQAAGTASTTQYICTNTTSGAKWTIVVDYAHQTADTAPASITDTAVSWQDPSNGSQNSLDRKSGDETAIYMSSVGGYILHNSCQPH